jgi:predicted polyphosphate/ATP-dependent NAD kinase
MGGKVGLKGTDGVYDEAVKRGATPQANQKAKEAITAFIEESDQKKSCLWFTCADDMGEKVLCSHRLDLEIVYKRNKNQSTAEDTKSACKQFLNHNVDLIVFCGGDGTARDIAQVIDMKIPLLGIPAGVKMHSGVFAVNPIAAGKMIHQFINDDISMGEVEIMDLDEDLYREGTWKIRLFNMTKGIIEPTYVQVGKMSFSKVSEDEVKNDIADHINDELEDHQDTLYLFGSGGTINHIAQKIGIENTLLGIDAIYQKRVIGKDLNEKKILSLVNTYPRVKVILSPIGAQGFILGRGNLQLSPLIIKKIGIDNIIVVSTPSKLQATPVLRVDTGDEDLDRMFAEYEMMLVVIGYRISRVVKIQQI